MSEFATLYGGAMFYIMWMMFWSKEARKHRRESKKLKKAEQLLSEKRYYDTLVELGVFKSKEK